MNNCDCNEKSDFFCPLTNEVICAKCCFERYSKKLDCPENCSMLIFNALNPTEFQKIALNTILKMRDMLLRLDDSYNLSFASDLRNINVDYEFADAEFSLFLHKHFFVNKSINGSTIYDFLSQHNFRSFSPEEIIILKAKKHSTPTLIEFRKKLDSNFFEAVDLLGDPSYIFNVCDSKIAKSNIQPASHFLVWLEKYPRFSALGHFAMQLPDYIIDDFIAELNALAISYGYTGEDYVKDYIIEYLPQTSEMIKDIHNEYVDEIMSPFDDDGGYFVKFFFEPENYWEIKEVLDTKEEFSNHELLEGEDEGVFCFEWVPAGDSKEVESRLTLFIPDSNDFSQNAIKTLGFILLYDDKIVVSSHSRLIIKFAEDMLKKYFPDMLK